MSEIEQKCQKIRLILSDVDGVLTDGTIWYNDQGVESKPFHSHDGHGIKLWQKIACHHFGIVTARKSQAVVHRAADLGISLVRQGVSDKPAAVREIMELKQLTFEQICFIGDDLPDLLPIRLAALGVAVSDAVQEVIHAADYVTQRRGGCGAVRETIELILKYQKHWPDLMYLYTGDE